jgi:L-fuculose-phosphate aldolase
MAMPVSIHKLKEEMCEIGRRIWVKGFCAGNEGNHSVRIGENKVLCTPTGLSKGFLTPDMICTVDMEGKQLDAPSFKWKRTSEVLVHLAIYKMRKDIGSVIHSHPPHATAFAIAGIPLPQGIHPEAEVFLGTVPTAPYATPSKQDLPDSITPLIGAHTNTVLMGNHGVVCFSKDLENTYYKLEIVDAYCRILLLCKQLGNANVLSPKQMTELLEVKAKFGLPDDRLACSAAGCVGEAAEPFLATFDKTASATCGCHDTPIAAPAAGDASFEQMVQMITDQIMAASK